MSTQPKIIKAEDIDLTKIGVTRPLDMSPHGASSPLIDFHVAKKARAVVEEAEAVHKDDKEMHKWGESFKAIRIEEGMTPEQAQEEWSDFVWTLCGGNF